MRCTKMCSCIQMVVISDTKSSWRQGATDVLQGLALEPILVSIFVNVLVRGQRVVTANLQVIQSWKAVSWCINLEHITDAVKGRVYFL